MPRAAGAPSAVATNEAEPTAEVPPIEGMSLATASELLQTRGLTLLVRDKQAHDTLPADSVIAQEPLPGSVLPTRSPVSVTLSSGEPAKIAVPDVTGQSVQDASRALEAAGLEVGAVRGPDSGKRTVKHTDPAAGKGVVQGATVALTVEAVGVEVPKLIGLPWARAKRLLLEAGLKAGKVRERYNEYRGAWVVLAQTPEAGTQVATGTAIDIVRNEGD